jgi:catecholate siderophore receptor
MSSNIKAGLRASLAMSCIGSALLPIALHAQTADQTTQGSERSLGGVTVTDTAIDDVADGRKQASPKAVRPLRDTPQTVTVISAQVMQQQNLLSLQDALSTVPGITFGAGEGGSGYGDSINLRGYSANNDITLDNVRSSAQYSRSDLFNYQSVEVTNGASSVTNGSGSVGGNINLVTKRPQDHDQAIVQGGVGTANYYRGTADINEHISDTVAFRLNAMAHHNDVPGRQVEKNDRWGIAPSVTVGMGTPTRLTLMYYHQEDRNIPQYGLPYFANQAATNGYTGALPGVDRSAYYGFKNFDTQHINSNQITSILEHDFSSKVKLRNLMRYDDVQQFTRSDGPEGTFCMPNNLTPVGLACAAGQKPGTFVPTGGSRGNTRDTRNQMFYEQADLSAVVNTGFIEHTIDAGVSASKEYYSASTGNSQRNADGSTPAAATAPYDLFNPNIGNTYTGPVNFIVAARNRNNIEDYAAYLFDAAKLSSHFELNGGVRIERNLGHTGAYTLATAAGAAPATANLVAPGANVALGQATTFAATRNAATLFSWRIGAVYKPVEAVSAYVAYGNSKTPSQNTVNGACTAVATSATGTTCNSQPEGAKNYEIGVKAELVHGLLLTAALFRNDRDSYKVPSGDSTLPDQTLQGHSRVDGIALGASGNITPAWNITANYTYLKSKLLQSVSDYCLAHPGAGNGGANNNCTNTAAVPNPGAGSQLVQTPTNSGSLFTTYRLPFGLTVGYGVTYQGSFALNNPTTTATVVYRSKAYTVHNATLAYDVTKRINLQVNVKNIGNRLYYTRIRPNNGWATPGDGRSAQLTATLKM